MRAWHRRTSWSRRVSKWELLSNGHEMLLQRVSVPYQDDDAMQRNWIQSCHGWVV